MSFASAVFPQCNLGSECIASSCLLLRYSSLSAVDFHVMMFLIFLILSFKLFYIFWVFWTRWVLSSFLKALHCKGKVLFFSGLLTQNSLLVKYRVLCLICPIERRVAVKRGVHSSVHGKHLPTAFTSGARFILSCSTSATGIILPITAYLYSVLIATSTYKVSGQWK